MFKEIKEFGQVIKELISEQIAKLKTFDVYVITDINENDYTVNIKHPTNNTLQYSNVKISSMCLGNFKGIMCFPSVDDYVLVGFLGDRSPIIIGNVFTQHDVIPIIKNYEMLISPKQKGSYIFFDENDNIKIKSGTATITIKDGVININDGSNGVARVGDSVEVDVPTHGICTGTITTGSSKVRSG